MQLGIIGLARSGKTSVFNAVTRGAAQVGAYSSSSQPNIGVVNVPDVRVDKLAEMYKPKKTTYATIQYVDFPAAGESFGKGEGPAGKFINDLGRMDALIHVVRAFEDDAVPHPEVTIDPDRLTSHGLSVPDLLGAIRLGCRRSGAVRAHSVP